MAKVRTQIQLEPADYRRIKLYAARHGISNSAAIRSLLRQALGSGESAPQEIFENFIRAAGKGRDREGRSDVAKRHDSYLYEEN